GQTPHPGPRALRPAAGDHTAAGGAAKKTPLPASNESFGLHLNRHTAAWDERWRAAGLHVAGDDAAQLALRFALYHLYGSANPSDEHVSIGARALSGKKYRDMSSGTRKFICCRSTPLPTPRPPRRC